MKDDLGTRIKENYENVTRYKLPRRTYTILRIDGKAFHTYTRGCERPFDDGLIADMQATALALCEQVQGAKFAYLQSDEISLVLTDFDDLNTQSWFDGNLQKMASISASIATAEFNKRRLVREAQSNIAPDDDAASLCNCTLNVIYLDEYISAHFDSRAFTIPSRVEVLNYLHWRQQDASKNSVSMVARSLFSHKELEGKSTNEMQEMIFQKSGKNWNDWPTYQKRGTCIYKKEVVIAPSASAEITPILYGVTQLIKSSWFIDKEAPIFSKDWSFFQNKIPYLA